MVGGWGIGIGFPFLLCPLLLWLYVIVFQAVNDLTFLIALNLLNFYKSVSKQLINAKLQFR